MEYTVPVYHALPFFTDKILAVPFVQKCWDVGKFCVGKVGTFVTDFRNVEGNVSILLERKYTCTQYLKVILKILIKKFPTYLILSILHTYKNVYFIRINLQCMYKTYLLIFRWT